MMSYYMLCYGNNECFYLGKILLNNNNISFGFGYFLDAPGKIITEYTVT